MKFLFLICKKFQYSIKSNIKIKFLFIKYTVYNLEFHRNTIIITAYFDGRAIVSDSYRRIKSVGWPANQYIKSRTTDLNLHLNNNWKISLPFLSSFSNVEIFIIMKISVRCLLLIDFQFVQNDLITLVIHTLNDRATCFSLKFIFHFNT